MINYYINSTEDYHKNELNSLGWELTVCNALDPVDSPCRRLIASQASFGENLYRFLKKIIPVDTIRTILEIGGGMGYLMRDFLKFNPRLRATMIDISPYLLDCQKNTLRSSEVDFLLADILTVPAAALSSFDLALMNENLGDLPTLVAGSKDDGHQGSADGVVHKIETFNKKYNLHLGANQNEPVNIGALETVEKLCLAGIQYIYLSEHSCEAAVPENMQDYLFFQTPGIPEMISLKGHRESP